MHAHNATIGILIGTLGGAVIWALAFVVLLVVH